MQKSFKNKFSWPNHPLISCIAYVILLFVEFKLCRLCPLIVLTLSFSCVSFDFLLCEIQIVLTLSFCCIHFDFFNFCRLCPSIVLTLSFYCVDFKCHMAKCANGGFCASVSFLEQAVVISEVKRSAVGCSFADTANSTTAAAAFDGLAARSRSPAFPLIHALVSKTWASLSLLGCHKLCQSTRRRSQIATACRYILNKG